MYDPLIHHRRSIRLPDFDYSQPGSFFVTICTQGRTELFGQVIDGMMQLNDAGKMAERVWKDLPNRFAVVTLDCHVVMPNHIHVLFQINDTSVPDRPGHPQPGHPQGDAPTKSLIPVTVGAPLVGAQTMNAVGAQSVMPTTVGDVIGAYKSLTTDEYIRGVHDQNWPSFPGRLWQRNYFEHIVRDDDEIDRIRKYIADNPRQWENGDMNFEPVL